MSDFFGPAIVEGSKARGICLVVLLEVGEKLSSQTSSTTRRSPVTVLMVLLGGGGTFACGGDAVVTVGRRGDKEAILSPDRI